MRFGFHISIAGGFLKVIERAKRLGCETIQIFSRSPRGWNYPKLDLSEAESFKERLKIRPFFVHMPYLPNLSSSDPELSQKSLESLKIELRRASLLDADGLVTHLGSHKGKGEERGIKNLIENINQALCEVQNRVMLLLENTAGQGAEIGYRLEQIVSVLAGIEDKERVGLCIDTAHAFEAGYDISSEEGLTKFLETLESLVGLEKVKLIHFNDSKTPLGSRKDRHWHIGEGFLGIEGISRFINHPALKALPAIMETPRKTDEDDLKNMARAREIKKKLTTKSTKIFV